jgi:hypothetical protein
MSPLSVILLCVALVGCAVSEDPRVAAANGDKIVLAWVPGGQKGEEAYQLASQYCRESGRIALIGAERDGSRMTTREFFCDEPPVRTAEGVTYR